MPRLRPAPSPPVRSLPVPHLLALALFAALPATLSAQPEDAAHRADRLRTIELNRRAHGVIDRRDSGNTAVREGNRRAMADYERRRAAWARQVEACRAGDWDACEAR